MGAMARRIRPALLALLVVLPLIGAPAALAQEGAPLAPPVAPPETAPTEAAEELIRERWAVIQIEGTKVGTVHSRRTSLERDGAKLVKSHAESNIKIVRGGVELVVEVQSTMVETAEGKPVSFAVNSKQSGMPVNVSGEMIDGVMNITQSVMGTEQKSQVELAETTVGPYGAELLMKEKGLAEGTTYELMMFVPDLARESKVVVEVKGKEEVDLLGEKATLARVESTIEALQGLKPTSWMNEKAEAMKEEVAFGGITQTTIYTSKEASEAPPTGQLPDLMVGMFITPSHPIAHPRGVRSATFRLRAKKGELRAPVEDATQKILERADDGSITLKITAIAPEGDTVPFPVEDPELAGYLAETVYLQCTDADIIAAAKGAVGEEKDAYRAAKLLEKWVFDNIDKKSLDVGFASAKETLGTRKGDCSEHGVLLAALARSVGIPARVATGVEYIMGIFGWHMWTEVWAGKWIPLDATLAAPFVDATHIKWADSKLDDASFDEGMIGMATLLGNVDVEVLEYQIGDRTVDPTSPEAQPKVAEGRYRHPTLGLEFAVPEGWTHVPGKERKLIVFSEPNSNSEIEVSALALNYDMSMERIAEELDASGRFDEKKEREVAGQPALEMRRGSKQILVIFTHEDMLYTVELEDPSVKALAEYEKLLESLSLGS